MALALSTSNSIFEYVVGALFKENKAFILCENEDLKIVENASKEIKSLAFLEDLGIAVVSSASDTGSLLTGRTWINFLAKIVDSSLIDIKSDCNLYSRIDSLLIKAAIDGSDGFRILHGGIAISDSISDYDIFNDNNTQICYGKLYYETDDIFIVAIGVLTYWIRNGEDLDCPLARLLCKLFDLGFFDLIPTTDNSQIESIVPLVRECVNRYANQNCLKDFILSFLVRGSERVTNFTETSSSIKFLITLLDKEWKIELPNAEDG